MLTLIIIFIIDLLLYVFAPDYMEKNYMILVLSIALITIIISFTNGKSRLEKHLHKIYLRHSVFFVICFCIVFFQKNIDYVLGIIDNSNMYLWIDHTVVCRALALSNLALCSFFLGYKLYTKKNYTHYLNEKRSSKLIFARKNVLNYIILFLLVIYIMFIPKEYLRNGYVSNVTAGSVGGIIGYLQAGFIACFTMYSIDYIGNNKNKSWFKELKMPLILISVYVLLIVMSGRRTEALRGVGLILISYITCLATKVNYKKIFLVGLILISTFSILGVIRTMRDGNIQEGARIISSYNSISPFTSELASSLNTLHIAMSICPVQYNYDLGETFIPSFFKIVPGLSFVYEKYIVGSSLKSSDEVITDAYFNNKNSSSWGLGSSVIADVYISFGTVGVCIAFFIFGYFIKFLEYITFIKYRSIYALSLSFSCYSAIIFVTRSSFSTIFLCWTYACILIWIICSKSVRTDSTTHKKKMSILKVG